MSDSALHLASPLQSFISLLASGSQDVRGSLAAVLGRPDLALAFWSPDDKAAMAGEGTTIRAAVPYLER